MITQLTSESRYSETTVLLTVLLQDQGTNPDIYLERLRATTVARPRIEAGRPEYNF